MCAEHGPKRLVPTLADQVEVEFSQGGQEAIRIIGAGRRCSVLDFESVVRDVREWSDSDEDAAEFMLQIDRCAVGEDGSHPGGPWSQSSDRDSSVMPVRPEDRMWIVVTSFDDTAQITFVNT
jgi:hypothetical protein